MPDDLKPVDWERQEGAAVDYAPDQAPRREILGRDEAPTRERTRDRQDEDRQGQADDEGGDAGGNDGKARHASPWKRILIIAGVALILLAAVYYWWSTRNIVTTDDAFTDGRAIAIAPQVSGYAVKLAVNDNQFVHKGDLLVQIDPRPYIAARDRAQGQLDLARAQLNASRYALEVAKVTFPARLQAAQARLADAQGTLFRAKTDYKRQHSVNKSATTQANIDASTAALDEARAQVALAEAQVREAEPVKPNVQQTGAQVSQLQAQVEEAQANLDQAKLNLGYTHVVAPQDGWVTKRNVEQGNYLQSATQVMSLVSPEVWVTANFKETQLTRMRPGQKVTINVDAYPSLKLKGHVNSVQLGSGSKFSAFPAENATGNFVKIVQRVPVKILIDSGLDPNLPLPLGLSVEPSVDVAGSSKYDANLPYPAHPTGNDPAALHRSAAPPQP